MSYPDLLKKKLAEDQDTLDLWLHAFGASGIYIIIYKTFYNRGEKKSWVSSSDMKLVGQILKLRAAARSNCLIQRKISSGEYVAAY